MSLQKIVNIQALRGIAALSVVAFHLIPIEAKYGSGEPILPSFFEFGMFGVDLFFVISGFVMASLTKGKFQNVSNALTFLCQRLSRIYPVYWLYSALVLIIFFIQPTWVNSAQDNQINILSSFLLWPEATLPLINVGWTLIHEMYFYIIFTAFLFFVPEKKLGLALSLWAITIIAVDLSIDTTSPVVKLISHPLTIEFIAGCFLAMLFRQDTGLKTAIIIALGAAAIVYLLVTINGSNVPQSWWRVGVYGVPSAAILYCLVVAERQGVVLGTYLV